ncbi:MULTISPECIES: GNAT family N-acetyltransferase [unclassified Sinorhizobium]|uniref:GNAT family N-acetyltransferase n=1 Tax=unclassified Sinorhizobium TaxID=2613772 RepID=UPI0035237F00
MTSEPENPDEPQPRRANAEIRAVRPSDTEAVTALMNLPGYRAGTLRPPFQRIEEVRRKLENPTGDSLNLVAVLDGEIVGNASMTRYSGRRLHAAGIGMGVHDDYCGRGIGTALLGALIDSADNWLDIKRLELTVYIDNTPGLRLYEKFGFEKEGLLRNFGFRAGSYVDAYTMARLRP